MHFIWINITSIQLLSIQVMQYCNCCEHLWNATGSCFNSCSLMLGNIFFRNSFQWLYLGVIYPSLTCWLATRFHWSGPKLIFRICNSCMLLSGDCILWCMSSVMVPDSKVVWQIKDVNGMMGVWNTILHSIALIIRSPISPMNSPFPRKHWACVLSCSCDREDWYSAVSPPNISSTTDFLSFFTTFSIVSSYTQVISSDQTSP